MSILTADTNWLKLMCNKEVINDIVNYIKPPKAKFGGCFMYGDKLQELVDEYTNDIVGIDFLGGIKRSMKKQSIYKNLREYFDCNPPCTKNETIYLIGDAFGSGIYVDIHWNCLIVKDDVIEWYDPAECNKKEVGYFDYTKKLDIISELNRFRYLKCVNIYGKYRAQYVLDSDYEDVDIFCQTWVLMYLFEYTNGQRDNFLQRSDLRPIVVKKWSKELFQSIEEYKHYIYLPKYKNFFRYYR